MIPTKFTGILEDWELTLLIFLLLRCLSPHFQLSKTWFPIPKALRSSKIHSGPPLLFPLLPLLPPKVPFLHLGVVATPSLVVLAAATMEAMVMDVVNRAPIPLDVKSARLKATLLIIAGAVMNVPNLRHSLLKLSTHLIHSQMVRSSIGSLIPVLPLT